MCRIFHTSTRLLTPYSSLTITVAGGLDEGRKSVRLEVQSRPDPPRSLRAECRDRSAALEWEDGDANNSPITEYRLEQLVYYNASSARSQPVRYSPTPQPRDARALIRLRMRRIGEHTIRLLIQHYTRTLIMNLNSTMTYIPKSIVCPALRILYCTRKRFNCTVQYSYTVQYSNYIKYST